MRTAIGLVLACAPLLGAGCDNYMVAKPDPGTAGTSGSAGGGGGMAGGAPDGGAPDGATDAGPSPGCPVAPATRPANTPTWSSISGLKNPQSWYATDAAAYVSQNVLYYQNGNGGWPKNIDMSYHYGVDASASPRDTKSMIDNSATTTQIRYLAFALGSWPNCQPYADGFNRGLQFLFTAQYPSNGGWPQVFPIEPTDYSRRITYNDNAMVHVMQIMRDIVYRAPLFKFVSADQTAKASNALVKGVDCMLKTQIVVDGKKTGWCAQHDEVTLLPANARSYELASHSGKEGAQVMAFLMTLDLAKPDMPRDGIIEAVEGAVVFYNQVKIVGEKYVQSTNDAGAQDSWIEADPNAEPIWARFYELEPPYRPFFCDRDGIKKYSLAEIGVERRGGYAWYGRDPATPLATTYPTWVKEWSVGRNVLTPSTDAGTDAPTPPDPDASTDAPTPPDVDASTDAPTPPDAGTDA